MTTKEGDHGRATLPACAPATCRRGRSSIPTLGSLVAKELGDAERRPAALRQHRAAPVLQPGRLRPRLPRAAATPR